MGSVNTGLLARMTAESLRVTERSPEWESGSDVEKPLHMCHIDTALGGYSSLALYEKNSADGLSNDERVRMQLAQIMSFCDQVRKGNKVLNAHELQYVMSLLDQCISNLSFNTGIADYRLVDLYSGHCQATSSEMIEIGDYLFEVAEELLWTKDQPLRTPRQ